MMEAKLVAKICSGQDGAAWGGFFFRFQSNGECCVYELERLLAAEGAVVVPFSTVVQWTNSLSERPTLILPLVPMISILES